MAGFNVVPLEPAEGPGAGFDIEPGPEAAEKGFDITSRYEGRTEPVAAFEEAKPGSFAPTTMGRALRRGPRQSAGLSGQLLKSIGDATGFASMIEVGDDLIREAFVEAISNPAEIEGLEDVTSFSKAVTFAAQTFGEQAFNLALAGTGAGLGGFLMRASIGKAALQGMTAKAARNVTLKGAAAGTFAAFYPINTGEIIQEQRDARSGHGSGPLAPGEPAFGASLVLGAVSSGLEVLGFGLVGKAIFGEAKKEVVESMIRTVLRRMGHASLKGIAAEGGTEAVQEVMVIASKKLNDPTFSIHNAITSSEGLSRIAFAGVSGAIVGGGLGGGGGVATGVRDAVRAGVTRSDIRSKIDQVAGAINGSVPSGSTEETESLFDIPLAIRDTTRAVGVFFHQHKVARKAAALAAKGTGTIGAAKAAIDAATMRFGKIMKQLSDENDALDQTDSTLAVKRAEFTAAIGKLKESIRILPTTTPSSKQGEAINKMSKEVTALLDEFNKLSPANRAARSSELLEKVRQLTSKLVTNPGAVAKGHISKLVKRVETFVNASHALSRKDSVAYRTQLQKLREKTEKAMQGLQVAKTKVGIVDEAETAEQLNLDLEPTRAETAEDQAVQRAERLGRAEVDPLPTTKREIVASAYQVLNGKRDDAFVVGVAEKDLPPQIRQLIKRKKLVIADRSDKELTLTLPGNETSLENSKQRSFTTQVEDIDAETAVVVKTISKQEVTPPAKVPEVVAKLEAQGEETEVITEPDVGITAQVEELNEEAERSVAVALRVGKTAIAELYRAVTGVLTTESDEAFAKHVANLPSDLVVMSDGTTWGEFQDMYADAQELAGLMVALENKMADPENFAAVANAALVDDVQDLQDFMENTLLDPGELFDQGIRPSEVEANVTFFGVTKNNRIVPVEIQTLENGERRVVTKKGVELKEPGKALRNRITAWAKTGEKPALAKAHEAAFQDAGFAVLEKIGGVTLIRTVFKGELNQGRIINQVRTITERGNAANNKGEGSEFVVKAKNRQGHTVWLHLSEVTELGKLLFPQRTSGVGFTLRDFWEGLAALQGDYGFIVDFNHKRDRGKVIHGNITYGNAELAAAVVLPTRKAEVREARLAKDQLKPEFIGAPSEEPGTKNESALDDAAVDPTIMKLAPGLKQQDQVANSMTDANGEVWTVGKTALNWLVKHFGIKENIIAFDEISLPKLLAGYRTRMQNARYAGDRETEAVFTRYVLELEKIQADLPAGRTILPLSTAAANIRAIHIFAKRKKKSGKFQNRRAFVLAHEFGHVVQHVYLSRLRPSTRAKIVKALAKYDQISDRGNGIEGFANWIAAYAANEIRSELTRGTLASPELTDRNAAFRREELIKIAEELSAPEQQEMASILSDMVKGLKAVWRQLKGVWSKKDGFAYPQEFADFVAGFNSHQKHRGDKRLPHGSTPSNLTTPLARLVFSQLQYADAGPFLPDVIYNQDKKTGEFTTVVSVGDTNTLDIDETADATVERANDSVFGNYVDSFMQWASTLKDSPAKAGKMLVYTADGELRGMGTIGEWLAPMFHALPSSTDPSLTVFREINMRAAPHFTKLSRILKAMPIARISLWEGFFNKKPTEEMKAKRALRDRVTEALLLQTKDKDLSADIKEDVRAVRKYLKELYTWYTGDMNMPLRERGNKDGVPSYYPLMIDTNFLEHNRGKFIEILRKYGFSEKDAQNIRMKITRDEDGGLTNGFHEEVTTTEAEFFGPGFAFGQQRADWPKGMRDELTEAGFYQKDIATTLIAYTEMMTRRAVWTRRFGETRELTTELLDEYNEKGINPHGPVAALQLKLHDARGGQLNEWQYQRIIKDILPAYAGQLGLRTNSHIRKISAGLVIYQNLRLLPFAIFAQFVDVGTLMSRGEFADTQASMKVLMSKTTRAQAMEMLEAIGAYRQGLTEHVLNDQALNTFMTGSAKRINDLFFRYNGMEGWTNLMRTMGLVAGREFLQRNARKAEAGNAKSQRYIDELSVTAAEVLAWDGHSTTNENINAALNRFIDEAMIRPDASIRPVWMSDPGYGIFAHLKGFVYGFHETFLRRVGREARIHQNLLPLLALGMLALPFAAVGYDLRRKILGSKEAPEGVSYMKELVERAGLFGAFQLVVDMEQADEYGKPFALGIGGPAVEQLFDFFDRDFSAWVPRAIPVVASSPVLRDWMQQEVLRDD